MGYWDKKEARDIEPEEEVQESPKSGDSIDYQALDQFEKDSNDRAKDILETVDDLASQVKAQKVHMGDITSATYWFAVCFNTQDQKEEYLSKMGYDPKDTFLGGREFAKKTGVTLEAPSRLYSTRKVFVKYSQRARRLKDKQEE